MTHWITKYALTEGILALEGAEETGDGYLSKKGSHFGEWHERSHFYGGNDWHANEAQAVAHAEQMRLKKIASLKKSLRKMEGLSFSLQQHQGG